MAFMLFNLLNMLNLSCCADKQNLARRQHMAVRKKVTKKPMKRGAGATSAKRKRKHKPKKKRYTAAELKRMRDYRKGQKR